MATRLLPRSTPGSAGRGRRRRGIPRVALTTAVTAALLVGLADRAYAGGPLLWANHNREGSRMAVCADDILVRSSPGGGPIGGPHILRRPQTFLVQYAGAAEFGGEWVYGFAYGDVNAHGWIQNCWFCLS
jgi:hypothetical protein